MTKYRPDGDTDFQLNRLLNDGLTLEDNFDGALIEVELEEGENEIQHEMGTIPVGYFVLYKEKDGSVFGTRKEEWSRQSLFLRSSVPNQTVRLFVM